MEDFNINEVDFFNFDLDKYIGFLLDKYRLFVELKYLPHYKTLEKDYLLRKWRANSHFLTRKNKLLPPSINALYDKRINANAERIEKLKGLCYNYDMLKFKCVSEQVKLENPKAKEYFLFTANELKNLDIKIGDLRAYFNLLYPNNITHFLEDLEDEYRGIPTSKEQFYIKKLKFLKEQDFVYLPQILRGDIVYNLDDEGNEIIPFYGEVATIQQIIYLETLIRGKEPLHPPTKPLQWTGQTNELATILIELQKAGLIKSSMTNIRRLIANNFTDKNGNKMAETGYLGDVFNTSKYKTSKAVEEFIHPLIAELTKNRPQR